LAERKGVKIIKSNDFETYWKLMEETTKRQQFFAHDKKYHQTMWETLNKTGIAHLFLAKFGDMTLTAWIVFLFNNVLYYPYGASSQEKRELMASNLMMWEVIKWGKINDAKTFDMWGAMGPNPDKTDPWYGFHRFKEGYNPSLVEFAGSYDLVINPTLYRLYNLSYKIRQLLLSFKSRFQ
ncbi:MAG: FemAB family protein, partial [Candidatus Gottesmanbacteria bacterium GW2011_GWC2_39_8]